MKTLSRTHRSLAVSALLLAACNPGWPPESQLTEFRVLAVRADPPEPARGATSQLTLVYADPDTRPVQVAWLACASAVDQSSTMDAGMGAMPGCALITPPGSPFPIPDLRTSVTMQVPATGGAPDQEGREAMTVIGFACAGGSIGAPSDGGTMPSCQADGGHPIGWQFTRTVRVHGPTALGVANTNPQISEVRFGMAGAAVPITVDSPPTVAPCTDNAMGHPSCTKWSFEVGFTAGSRENYLAPDGDGGTRMITELLTTGFVTDQGTLGGGFRTDSLAIPMSTMQNDWTAPSGPVDAHVYFVVSDGRGGIDSTMRVVHVR